MRTGDKDVRFGKRAGQYDDGFEGRLARQFYGRLLEQLDLFDGAVVLDAGCGTGALLRFMAERWAIAGFGIDMEPNMVEQARRKCPEMDIRQSASEASPFEDGKFDAITACIAYHHFSDKPGFVREAARLLKPGGVIYIADVRFVPPFRHMVNGLARLFRIVGRFGNPKEIYADFAKAGFLPLGHSKKGFVLIIRMKKP